METEFSQKLPELPDTDRFTSDMNKKERAKYIEQRLQELYPRAGIPLKHRDPYTLLVAVILSAQCTDKRVNEVSPHLFAAADNPAAMAKTSAAKIESIIKPLGLAPRKAQAISELSKILMEKHDGEVPDNFEDLEALPGVGHKSASVVMNQAFGHPAFPVDTHIHRLTQRWGLSSGRNVVQTEKDLKRLFPQDAWGRLHLQIIYYGRQYCTARSCDGTVCEICRTCFPRRRKPVQTKKA